MQVIYLHISAYKHLFFKWNIQVKNVLLLLANMPFKINVEKLILDADSLKLDE